MDLKHLRTFVTVAEAQTELKASQLLHISQSALSRQVSNLEQEFDSSCSSGSGGALYSPLSGSN